jgi:predicted RNase H-like HicB family nuclease
MTQDTYSLILYWSDDDEAFIVSVPELPGCMAHGETRGRAIQQIEIAIENWIDTAREIGREIPNPPKHMADYEKELDQRTRETLEAGLQNAMPAITEALAKEIAKSGKNVWTAYSRERGIECMSQEQPTEPISNKIKTILQQQTRAKDLLSGLLKEQATAEDQKSGAGRAAGRPFKRAVRKS